MSDKASTRARQACEPCRRKKTKCPGEKPVCSFCQRLGQKCSYDKGDDNASRVQKPTRSGSHDSSVGSKDRLHRLESRVEEVFDILTNLSNQNGIQKLATPPRTAPQTAERNRPQSFTSAQNSPMVNTTDQSPRFDENHHPEPPLEIWPRLIEIYRKKFDCQPLPILGTQVLLTPPTKWPKHLRYSFLSLTVPFITNYEFYSGAHEAALTFYTEAARQDIFRHVADGKVSVELLQAACLSASREIIGSNPLGAWMMISTGIRLAISTGIMLTQPDVKLVIDQDVRSRCCWSLFALDRAYGSTLTVPPALSTESILPDYPTSTPCPTISEDPPDQINSVIQVGPVKDCGVVANYLQLLSIHGLVMSYLQSVKDGEPEDAWSVESSYQKVMARLFSFETGYAQANRFQQNRFQEHDGETLESQRSYWAPWLAGQILFHTIQSLINHPFLHTASRSRRQSFQPPSFLQNSIDQAVLHSSWIVKLIEVCNDTGFTVNDPFVAHLAAVNATIYLFLLNAKDAELAAQARLGFERCYAFIQKQTDSWPHLRHTIDKLNILQHAAITNSNVPIASAAPKAQRSLLWELLDYSASTIPSRVPEFTSDAVDLNVDTRFLSPLNPLSSGLTPTSITQQNNSQPQPRMTEPERPIEGTVWDPAMDTLAFNLFDNETMADLTNMTFGRDIWSFGQL